MLLLSSIASTSVDGDVSILRLYNHNYCLDCFYKYWAPERTLSNKCFPSGFIHEEILPSYKILAISTDLSFKPV